MALAALAGAQIPGGEGAILVEARDALTQTPLAGVTVQLSSGAGVSRFSIVNTTGGDGALRIAQLPAGDYQVTADRAGYLTARLYLVRLGEGKITERVNLPLTQQSAVEGTVFDEEGQPLYPIAVYPHPVHSRPTEGADTDQTGHYRAGNLPAGEYRIEVRVPYELRKRTLRRDPGTGEVFGYPPTAYYPAAADSRAAVAIQLTPGVTVPRLDIHLRRVPLVEFSGQLIERSGGEPKAGAKVELIDRSSAYNDYALAARETTRDGRFHFEMLQPGHYDFAVYHGAGGLALPTVIPVDIPKTGVTERIMVAPTPQPLIARVLPMPDGLPWTGYVYLNLLGANSLRTISVEVGKDAVIDQVPPGQWTLEARSWAGRALNNKFAVAGVTFGSQDALAGPFLTTESGNPVLEITLTGDTGAIAGLAVRDETHPFRYVLARRPGHALSEIAQVGSDGSFHFRDLAPGTYELRTGDLEAGIKVEVRPGQTSSVRIARPN